MTDALPPQYELTEGSPRAPSYAHGSTALQLMPHQLAMLHRCLQIENMPALGQGDPKVGIVRSAVGSGKTFLMLVLFSTSKRMNKKKSAPNLVVVPQGIHTQWLDEVDRFNGDQQLLTCRSYTEYHDISSLYASTDSLKGYDVLVTTPLYYESIATISRDSSVKLERICFDEIDATFGFVRTAAPTKQVWYVSATFRNGLVPGRAQSVDLYARTCSCTSHFVESSISLPPPQHTTVMCKDVYVDRILAGFLSASAMEEVNAGDFSSIRRSHKPTLVTSAKEAVAVLLENCVWQIDEATQHIKDNASKPKIVGECEKIIREQTRRKEAILERLQDNNVCLICFEETALRECVSKCCQNVFCMRCIKTWLDGAATCPACRQHMTLENIVALESTVEPEVPPDTAPEAGPSIDPIVEDESWPSKTDAIMRILDEAGAANRRFLIFSNFLPVVREIQDRLFERGTPFVKLDGGNVRDIDTALARFKSGDATVLFADGTNFGRGLNLAMTTDIVFVHQMSSDLQGQVIGRAQRYGRTCKLKVHHIHHANEEADYLENRGDLDAHGGYSGC